MRAVTDLAARKAPNGDNHLDWRRWGVVVSIFGYRCGGLRMGEEDDRTNVVFWRLLEMVVAFEMTTFLQRGAATKKEPPIRRLPQ